MFSYYLQDRSYYFASDSEVISHINELNNIIAQSDGYDHFFRYKNFEKTLYDRKACIEDFIISGKIPEYIVRRVYPAILRHVRAIDSSFMSLSDMDKELKRTYNAFLGPRFHMTSNGLLSSYNDYYLFRESYINKNVAGNNFKKCCEITLRNVVVTNDAYSFVKSRGKEARVIFDKLTELDKYISSKWTKGHDFNENHVRANTTLDISDESDTTKNTPQYRAQRYFNIKGKGGHYCYIHIKFGNGLRCHIYPDNDAHIIYVPYIGPHLKSKLNP